MTMIKICFVLFTVLGVGFSFPLQNNVSPAEYESRFNKTVECIKKMYNEGKPEIGLASHDPLVMEDLVVNFDVFGLSFLQGNITFKKLTFYDVTKFVISEIEATDVSDPEAPKFHIVMEWPVYSFDGIYDINAIVKETSVTGKGKISEAIKKYKYDFNFKAALPLTKEDFSMKFSFEDLDFHIDELFVNGKDISSEIMQNAKASVQQIKQNAEVINKSITDVMIKIINSVYAAKKFKKEVIAEMANCWKASKA